MFNFSKQTMKWMEHKPLFTPFCIKEVVPTVVFQLIWQVSHKEIIKSLRNFDGIPHIPSNHAIPKDVKGVLNLVVTSLTNKVDVDTPFVKHVTQG